MLLRVNLKRAATFFLLLGTVSINVAAAKDATGTLRIQFMGHSFKELGVYRVEPSITGVKWDGMPTDNPSGKDIVLNVPPGKHMLSLLVDGRIPFLFDAGSVSVRAGKETVKKVDLSQFMGAIRLEVSNRSLLRGSSIWLYHPDRDDRFNAFAKIHVPKDGIIDHVPATRMWMVVVDGNKVPLQAQFIHPIHGQQTTIAVSKPGHTRQYPVRVRLRLQTDAVKESDLSFQLTGSRNKDFKQVKASEFYTEVQPGYYRIQVANKGKEHSSGDFFIMDESVEMALVVDGSGAMRFCSSKDMKRANDLFHEGERLVKSSRLEDALLFYDFSNECMTDNRAQHKVVEIGQRLAARAEKNKRYFSGSNTLYTARSDSSCQGSLDVFPTGKRGVCAFGQMIVSKPEAGAIEWLTAIESPEAGRVAIRYVQSIPAHDPGALLLTPHFFDDKGMLERIKASFSSILDVALQKEDEMFRRSQDFKVDIAGTDPGEAAFTWLKIATSWASQLDQVKQEVVRKRASQRGEALKQGMTPQALALAIDYYEFTHDRQGVESTKKRASKLGHQHLKQGDTSIAEGFFRVADDSSGKQLAEEARNAAAQRDKVRVKKRKKKFMKEMENFEEEFGF